MMPKLSDPVSECRRRAEESGRRACAIDAASIKQCLEMEQRWFFLARGREYAERVGRFIASRPRGGKPG
jgi:hypothetical protein